MIDLHTHSIFSDGELIPSELVRRFEILEYTAVAITDHADSSNIDLILPRIVRVAEDLNRLQAVKVVPGIELTHIPPRYIPELIKKARDLGARLVVVHGETIVEPVAPGTNRAALEAGVDILAHPGLISREEVKIASERGVYLEISARRGHCLANGHVAHLAYEIGAALVLNSDAHGPGDLMSEDFARKVAEGAGLEGVTIRNFLENSRRLLERIGVSL
ncbi:MAG: histidinol phosphate phosphatase domain-containing protein [Deltaproteobacteria bacterium]|nr:histidinol phosphate phosphatase domain-containing protein [Deltaproteobacteria bacterium]MBW2016159.1 histidinol phosphate phosphatase domain-containing protein [Deltaproteobacteria bacterium]MBW2130499.1 histidinol phosphate phosphatase domain-containing protein [Deltaproteobacteria bacterium]MBW2302555.1 histidinol phosphate phosphatase domain-containing protein [Deltaproteobacteria bacterium]